MGIVMHRDHMGAVLGAVLAILITVFWGTAIRAEGPVQGPVDGTVVLLRPVALGLVAVDRAATPEDLDDAKDRLAEALSVISDTTDDPATHAAVGSLGAASDTLVAWRAAALDRRDAITAAHATAEGAGDAIRRSLARRRDRAYGAMMTGFLHVDRAAADATAVALGLSHDPDAPERFARNGTGSAQDPRLDVALATFRAEIDALHAGPLTAFVSAYDLAERVASVQAAADRAMAADDTATVAAALEDLAAARLALVSTRNAAVDATLLEPALAAWDALRRLVEHDWSQRIAGFAVADEARTVADAALRSLASAERDRTQAVLLDAADDAEAMHDVLDSVTLALWALGAALAMVAVHGMISLRRLAAATPADEQGRPPGAAPIAQPALGPARQAA